MKFRHVIRPNPESGVGVDGRAIQSTDDSPNSMSFISSGIMIHNTKAAQCLTMPETRI